MELSHVVFLCKLLQKPAWHFSSTAGGGIDALLAQQTRPHSDLDIAAKFEDLPAFEECLRRATYLRSRSEEDGPWNMVFGDSRCHFVDLRGFRFDGDGHGILGTPRDNMVYPASALAGSGFLEGMTVRCVVRKQRWDNLGHDDRRKEGTQVT
ncbi:nucleotidyltransferase domain-containing protein [Bradyrhizobium sp. SZCCHNS1054]|uniref:nucleotidyltransferase domain-containing protein n=1 Tax=Bradyrhizobium sp. SZCCHNS1054 TaxID=3057301 RepID=UPI003966E884